MAKALRQVDELIKMKVWGYRAEVTYKHVRKFAERASGTFAPTFLEIVQQDMTAERLNQCRHFWRVSTTEQKLKATNNG